MHETIWKTTAVTTFVVSVFIPPHQRQGYLVDKDKTDKKTWLGSAAPIRPHSKQMLWFWNHSVKVHAFDAYVRSASVHSLAQIMKRRRATQRWGRSTEWDPQLLPAPVTLRIRGSAVLETVIALIKALWSASENVGGLSIAKTLVILN